MKVDPPAGRQGIQDTSLIRNFSMLRVLLCWMASQGHRRFTDLDHSASQLFLASIAARKTKKGQPLRMITQHNYRVLMGLMYLQGGRYP
jgi:hypothetical protein